MTKRWSAGSARGMEAKPAVDDYEVEIQRLAGPTIGNHGYIRIKKLNSGG